LISPGEARLSKDISGHDRNGFLFPLLNQWSSRIFKITPGACSTGDGGDRNMRRFSMKSTIQGSLFAIGALALLLQPSAQASCVAGGAKVGLAPSKLALKLQNQSSKEKGDNGNSKDSSIVGLWHTTFLFEGGVWDEAFEQWHSDGTETALDNAVPPLLGNVCLGIYKQSGPRTYKLRHLAWNWDPSGAPLAGTFLLLMTVTVDPHGDTFTGTWVSDSFDTFGNKIDELHFEGTVSAERITVD
jgi:hypothetical protein